LILSLLRTTAADVRELLSAAHTYQSKRKYLLKVAQTVQYLIGQGLVLHRHSM